MRLTYLSSLSLAVMRPDYLILMMHIKMLAIRDGHTLSYTLLLNAMEYSN